MSARPGDGVDAAERRAAVRALLLRPLLTPEAEPEAFRLVRRHRDELTRLLADGLGYRLVVEPTVARLVKPGLGRDATRQLLRPRRDGRGAPFSPRGYALLCLTIAALTRARAQLLVDELVTEVRSAAVDAGIEVDLDTSADRRALHGVLLVLVDLGVLTERDGDLERWGERADAQSLLDVHRDRLRLLVQAPLGAAGSAGDLLDAPADDALVPSAAGGARVAVRRHLLERPVLSAVDLPEGHADWWSKNRHRESEWFREMAGLELELRAEGALAYDPDERLTDDDFPGAGSLKQFALLLLAEVVAGLPARAAPESGPRAWATVPPGLVERCAAGVTAQHASAFRQAYRDDPQALLIEAIGLLVGFGLVEVDPGGVWRVHAAASRYRPVAAAPAGTTHAGTTSVEATAPSLFDGAGLDGTGE